MSCLAPGESVWLYISAPFSGKLEQDHLHTAPWCVNMMGTCTLNTHKGFYTGTRCYEDRVHKRQGFPAENSLTGTRTLHSVCASHVGSHTDRTWKRASSSQLHGGYEKVNSAARERTPKLMFKNTRLCTCSFSAALKSPPLPFSASLGKICAQ